MQNELYNLDYGIVFASALIISLIYAQFNQQIDYKSATVF